MLLSGCATKDNFLFNSSNQDPKYIYAKGHESLQNEDYTQAIQTLKVLNSHYPFKKYTELGNLDLIYAYYQKNDLEMVLALANKFISHYPQSKQLAYIFYMKGVAKFNKPRAFLKSSWLHSKTQHNYQLYMQSVFHLQRSVHLNPNSHFAEDAIRRILYIRNIMSEHQYHIATFYFTHKAYIAAINRAKIIVEKYPQSTSIENALILMIRSYNNLRMFKLSEQSMAVLKANYPENHYLKSKNIKEKKAQLSYFN